MGWGKGRGGQKRGRKKTEMDGEKSDLISEPTKSGSVEESIEKAGAGCVGGGRGGFFACYLLTSLSPRHKGQTYIGFTVNPRRRIRQHNGEISSGAFRTKKKRPWEMVLCIYGFPTNVYALQFEWAWQHPKESINAREAAATLKSISGLANKIKLAYKMLNLPAWNSLNITVNIFSSKYTIHSAGIDLPKHMKSQICSMDELPCYTDENGYGFFDDDLNGEEDDLSVKIETHIIEDYDGNEDISHLKTLSSSLCGGNKVLLTDETCSELSDKNETHIIEEDEGDQYISPLKTLSSSLCGDVDVQSTHEISLEMSDKNETRIREDDDGDKDMSPLKPFSSSLCGGDKVWLTEETIYELSSSDDDDNRHCINSVEKSHEVDFIDLLSPSPVRRTETYGKKKRKMTMDVIDLTKSPVFV